ncbi:hypothetical protein BR63_02140 [Thermanaerosceptrum fracticalcis]|uniref:Integrase catalytic domain-containing protein n=1 Tax=Thermanaerosceptrum fracticalcis TaxID=1712410 RepID=A0A7G6DZG6_THEFR|nr:hypothetical protein BR63_02140 [Thermanaerosceptrum fracticalcis]
MCLVLKVNRSAYYDCDITYIPKDEGWLYLAAVEDLFHKKVVGWALDSRMIKQPTIDAIEQAIIKEKPAQGL